MKNIENIKKKSIFFIKRSIFFYKKSTFLTRLPSLCGHFAITKGSLCHHQEVTLPSPKGHFALTKGSLCPHPEVTLPSLWGHFAITLGSLWGYLWGHSGLLWSHFGVIWDRLSIKHKNDKNTKMAKYRAAGRLRNSR